MIINIENIWPSLQESEKFFHCYQFNAGLNNSRL